MLGKSHSLKAYFRPHLLLIPTSVYCGPSTCAKPNALHIMSKRAVTLVCGKIWFSSLTSVSTLYAGASQSHGFDIQLIAGDTQV